MKLNNFSQIIDEDIIAAAKNNQTPFYLYDEAQIIKKCDTALSMPNAYGLGVRYAMKANSTKAILKTITGQGINIDASSLNEAKRAHMAGVSLDRIMLTTQEVPFGFERKELETFILKGMKYNVCSLNQYNCIKDFAIKNNVQLSVRIHPGVGSGESATRNTGDNYSCFGVHLSNLPQLLADAKDNGIVFNQVHVHIGSGADPVKWRENIDLELSIIEKYFDSSVKTVSFGGGIKEARMPNEIMADINDLGEYAKAKITEFYEKTGIKLKAEIEPGTFIVANSGYCVTTVIDKKDTGTDGLNFVLLNGGMEINARPLMYASKHPFYVVSKEHGLKSSEFNEEDKKSSYKAVVVGRCCESGDSQCLDENDTPIECAMIEPEIDDLMVIGGTGAYCSSMTPFNYNSHQQIAEIMVKENKEQVVIRKRQSLEQIVANEI